MGGFIRSDVKKEKCSVINVVTNKRIVEDFKGYCKKNNYPMNLMLELCMKQFVDGKISVDNEKVVEINKLKEETLLLNTTINSNIYQNFKVCCKENGYKMKNVITDFMINFVNGNFIIEVKKVND